MATNPPIQNSVVDNAGNVTVPWNLFFQQLLIQATKPSLINLQVYTNNNPQDGDLWRADNTNTGLKIRINGVTKTVTVT